MKKKVLYLGYKLYGYENEIIAELAKKAEIVFIEFKPSIWQLAMLRFLTILYRKESFEKMLVKIINKKILKQIEKIKTKKFDILFVIGWSLLKMENLKFLENFITYKEKKLYLWDDISKVKNFFEYKNYFDNIYSFDKKDCKNYKLNYRPTFYSERLKNIKKLEKKYDLSFVGFYNLKRDVILEKIKRNNRKIFFHLYFNPFIYFFKYFFNKNYRYKNINFFKIPREKYNEIIKESEIIVDIISDSQSGITQRVLDAIYLNKKIITNNQTIKEYDFYIENNILIINENISETDLKKEIENFKDKNYINLPKDIIQKYSIQSWIKDIFKNL